jgi:peptidoglycan/LPS O-acetylase OafA/YrhL
VVRNAARLDELNRGPSAAAQLGEPSDRLLPARTPPTRPARSAAIDRSDAPRDRLRYQPGLDGLRALSVAAVILYHGEISPFHAGFFGVDVFFVISGYLITSLLLGEWNERGHIDLRQFYLRRARRLLPALFLMLLAVVLYARAFLDPVQRTSVPGDVAASLLYVQNWHLVFGGGYFGGESLFRHLWSLAIEEQFYAIWPAVFAVVLARRGVAGRARLRSSVVAVALVSIAAMAWTHRDFDPDALNDAYLSTHTRAFTILAGVLLAFVWPAHKLRARRGATPVVDGLGLIAVGALVYMATEYSFEDPFLYPIGFVVVAVLATVAVAVVVHPASRVVRLALSTPLLVGLGRRSYGLYLWNWPVVQLTSPGEDIDLHGWALAVLRLVLTLVLTEVSFRLVEEPIRRGTLREVLDFLALRTVGHRRVALGLIAGVVVATALMWIGRLPDRSDFEFVTPSSRPTDPTTATVDRDTSTTRETRATFAPPIRTIVVGDSVANTLVINAPSDLGSTITLTNGSVEGCGVSRGRIASTRGLRRDLGRECEGWQRQWADATQDVDAQIALVTIGAWDVFDVEIDDRTLEFGTDAWDLEFSNQLRSGIDSVTATGAQVALAELPCWRPIDAGGLLALPERGDDTRTRHLNTLLRRAARRDPDRVFTVEPPVEYCTDDAIANDVGERWDGVHYYIPGSARYFSAVAPQLLAIPQPPE